MKASKIIFATIFSFVLVISISSCSRKLLSPTLLSYKENIFNESGIKVTGISSGLKSQKAAIKEATENALKSAGPDYDILSNVEIKVNLGLLSNKYVVTGIAHKSGNINR